MTPKAEFKKAVKERRTEKIPVICGEAEQPQPLHVIIAPPTGRTPHRPATGGKRSTSHTAAAYKSYSTFRKKKSIKNYTELLRKPTTKKKKTRIIFRRFINKDKT